MATTTLFHDDVKAGTLPTVCCSCDRGAVGLKKLKFTLTPVLEQVVWAAGVILYPWMVVQLGLPRITFTAWVFILLRLRQAVKRQEILLPVCEKHRRMKRLTVALHCLWIIPVIGFCCLAAYLFGIGDNHWAIESALAGLTVAIFVAPLAFLSAEFGLKVSNYTRDSLTVTGVSVAFAQAVEAMDKPGLANDEAPFQQGQIKLTSAKYYRRRWEVQDDYPVNERDA
jgi:hypothetical protein